MFEELYYDYLLFHISSLLRVRVYIKARVSTKLDCMKRKYILIFMFFNIHIYLIRFFCEWNYCGGSASFPGFWRILLFYSFKTCARVSFVVKIQIVVIEYQFKWIFQIEFKKFIELENDIIYTIIYVECKNIESDWKLDNIKISKFSHLTTTFFIAHFYRRWSHDPIIPCWCNS